MVCVYPSEKYEFVSSDDDVPNMWENKSHVSNHQPARVLLTRMMTRMMTLSSFNQHECRDLLRLVEGAILAPDQCIRRVAS